MARFALAGIAGFVLFGGVFAAPVPKEVLAPPLESLFGVPFDPSQSCTYKLDGKKLVFGIPKTVESPAIKLSGCPRTKREVSGNFELEAVVWYILPDPPAGAHAGAGIAIWADDVNFALVNRHHWPSGKKWAGGFDVHYENSDGNHVSHGATADGVDERTPARLKLRRVGDSISTYESRDNGKTWNKLTEADHKLPLTVNAGLIAHNSLKAKMEIHCESLTITPIAKK